MTSAAKYFPLVLVAFFAGAFASAKELSFKEEFAEHVVSSNGVFTVAGDGTLSIHLSLPISGISTNLPSDTPFFLSVGNFQLSKTLGQAANFTNGVPSVTFVETGLNGSGALIETKRFIVTWSRSLLTISGTSRDAFATARNHLSTPGNFQEAFNASVLLGNWQITDRPVYVSGRTSSVFKRVGSGTSAQEFELKYVQASGAADYTAPTVSITRPAANTRIVSTNVPGSSNLATFATNFIGTATDNVDVAQILYRLAPSTRFQPALGTTNWRAENIAPIPGTNTFYVKALDSNGNVSKVSSVKFFYSELTRLSLTNSGIGSVSGLNNGQLVEIGRGYSVTANPAKGYLFSRWSGSVKLPTTAQKLQNPSLAFVMTSNGVLQANFVPDRFPDAAGNYAGVFSETANVNLNSAGLMTFRLSRSGAFSGKIFMAGTNLPISGTFHPTGTANLTLPRKGQAALKLSLLLDFAGSVSGTVAAGNNWIAQFDGHRAAEKAAGKFTLLIPRSEVPGAPAGFGWATLSRSSRGNLRVIGTLADGTRFSQSTLVGSDGSWPLFASLYRGEGLLFCAMAFPSDPNNDIYGEPLTWIKTTNAANPFYRNGFALSGPVVGSTHLRAQQFRWTSGSLELGEGNIFVPRTNQVGVGPRNQLTVSGNTTLRVSQDGSLSGSFVHPQTGRRTLLKGVFLQKPQWGAGYFLGPTESGYFLLQPAPPASAN